MRSKFLPQLRHRLMTLSIRRLRRIFFLEKTHKKNLRRVECVVSLRSKNRCYGIVPAFFRHRTKTHFGRPCSTSLKFFDIHTFEIAVIGNNSKCFYLTFYVQKTVWCEGRMTKWEGFSCRHRGGIPGFDSLQPLADRNFASKQQKRMFLLRYS